MSWLKAVGHFLGKIVGAIVNVAGPVEKVAAPVVEALLPMYAPLISTADSIFSKIVAEAVAAETLYANVDKAGTQKLQAVLANIGPVLDQWIANAFPGSKQVSAAVKTGLVNAVVAVVNELEAPPALAASTTAPAPAASAPTPTA